VLEHDDFLLQKAVGYRGDLSACDQPHDDIQSAKIEGECAALSRLLPESESYVTIARVSDRFRVGS